MNEISLFLFISLIAGSLAIYFYIQIYRKLAKASFAWLLLAVTAIFMIEIPLIPSIMLFRNSFDLTLLILLLSYWSAIYTATFAWAGYLLYKAFVYVPRKSIGKFIFEGYEKKNLKPIKNEILKKLSKFVLIFYTSAERYEDAIIKLALMHVGEGRRVAICTCKHKAKVFEEYLKKFIENGEIKVITEDIENIHVPKGTVLIIENIHDYTYDSLLKYIEQFDGCRLIVFADRKDSLLEGLFIDIFEIRENVAVNLKRRKRRIKIPIESIIDYTSYNLRGAAI